MREKVLTTVVTFGTTTQAIAMERECKKTGFEGRLIPVPREISASCGLAWKCAEQGDCLLYTSPSPRDLWLSRMPSSA